MTHIQKKNRKNTHKLTPVEKKENYKYNGIRTKQANADANIKILAI